MKAWLEGSGAVAAALLASTTLAADHRDGGPTLPTDTPGPDIDIDDVYAWTADDNTELVLMMTLGGLGGATEFSDAVQYVFHVGRTDGDMSALFAPAPDQTLVVCEFDSPTNGTCTLGNEGEPAVDWVSGDLSIVGGAISDSGLLRVHAGYHADPFFFHLAGFNEARKVIVEDIAPSLQPADFEASGCIKSSKMYDVPAPATPLFLRFGDTTYQQILAGLLTGALDPACMTACVAGTAGQYSTNFFHDNDVLGLVVQLDKTLIAGRGEYFQIHATTHTKPGQ